MVDELEGVLVEDTGGRFIEAPWGKRYQVANGLAAMPYLKFAHLAHKGMDSADMEAMAAMYNLLRVTFTKDAWAEFEEDATENRASDEDLFKMMQQALELMTARPTKSPSASSDGPQPTTENSTAPSSFEEQKRHLGLVPVERALLAG